MDYEKVVHPKALRVRDTYPEAATTSGFLNVLEERGYQEVLQWNDEVVPVVLVVAGGYLLLHVLHVV